VGLGGQGDAERAIGFLCGISEDKRGVPEMGSRESNALQAGAGVSLVPSSASRMRVPIVCLLDTHLAEAKWKIGLTWPKRDQSDPLVRNFVSLARRLRNAAP
jgi:hypothetical protein